MLPPSSSISHFSITALSGFCVIVGGEGVVLLLCDFCPAVGLRGLVSLLYQILQA